MFAYFNKPPVVRAGTQNLSRAQKERIEQNRLAALQRLKQKITGEKRKYQHSRQNTKWQPQIFTRTLRNHYLGRELLSMVYTYNPSEQYVNLEILNSDMQMERTKVFLTQAADSIKPTKLSSESHRTVILVCMYLFPFTNLQSS